MRGIYNADFTVDVLPQAALRLHAVKCTQPLQGCIITYFLSILTPTCINWCGVTLVCAPLAWGVRVPPEAYTLPTGIIRAYLSHEISIRDVYVHWHKNDR